MDNQNFKNRNTTGLTLPKLPKLNDSLYPLEHSSTEQTSMSTHLVVNSIAALREKIEPLKRAGKRIGLVPTMGALHDGHLSLARYSVEKCDCTIVTIFVNPTQFAVGEDLDKYPQTLDEDIKKLSAAGVDFTLVPDNNEIYPQGYSTAVQPPEIAKVLEGEFRQTHFGGVCTVVLKLLNIAKPNVAFFGQKDFQQVAVVRQMVTDLNIDVEIVSCPIVRDPDGLAMSSRNRYLDSDERQIALNINRTIRFAVDEIEAGQTDAHCLMAEMRQMLIDNGVTSIDYAAVCDSATLKIQNQVKKPAVILIAAMVGKTRLIDNSLVE